MLECVASGLSRRDFSLVDDRDLSERERSAAAPGQGKSTSAVNLELEEKWVSVAGDWRVIDKELNKTRNIPSVELIRIS